MRMWKLHFLVFFFLHFAGKTYGDDGGIWVRELHSAIITADNSPHRVRVNFCSIWRWCWGGEDIEILGNPKDSNEAIRKKMWEKEYKWISYLFEQLFIELKYIVANGTDRRRMKLRLRQDERSVMCSPLNFLFRSDIMRGPILDARAGFWELETRRLKWKTFLFN